MIINTNDANIETIGDVTEFKTCIDPKNLEFITTLLSSNLYSHPEQSFIREIVSNAWDAHVEANTTDVPVIIKIDCKNLNSYRYKDYVGDISIRDFGTGLSPERFKEIYCNIGSSTKRESNDFLGGFGIGHWSMMSCSNTAYVNSYYEGKLYMYIITKSGNTIVSNLVATLDTTEKNGVEVILKNRELDKYKESLKYIMFFPNVYIDSNIPNTVDNSNLIKHYNKYAASNICLHNERILLGNVLYPLDESILNKSNSEFIHKLKTSGVVIKFNIGELNITPNRESIIYSTDTIDLINTRIEEAKQEFYSNICKHFTDNFNDLFDYYNFVCEKINYNYLYDKIETNKYTNFTIIITKEELNNDNITYKEKTLGTNDINLIRILFNSRMPTRALVLKDRVITSSFPKCYYEYMLGKNLKFITLKSNNDKNIVLTSSIKKYLSLYYPNHIVLNNFTLEEYKSFLQIDYTNVYNSSNIRDFITEEFYNYIHSKAIQFNPNDSNYLFIKDQVSKEKKNGVTNINNVILYIHDERSRRFKNVEAAIKWMKDKHKGIILAGIKDDIRLELDVFKYRNNINKSIFSIIKANKETIQAIKSYNPSCLTTIDKYMSSKDLSYIKTVIESGIINTYDSLDYDTKQRLDCILNKRDCLLLKQVLALCVGSKLRDLVDTSNTDKELESKLTKLKLILRNSATSISAVYNNSFRNNNLVVRFYMFKVFKYRLDFNRFKEITNNHIIKLFKNEVH